MSKLAIVEEEAAESLYWMELLVEAELVSSARVVDLMNEANEIVAMTVASLKTLRSGQRESQTIQNPKSKIQNGKWGIG
jgi:hypothetical protein